MRLRAALVGPLLLLVTAAGCELSPASARREAGGVETRTVTITTARARTRFNVELARTPEQQERGLMFRTSLPPMGGMLFLFKRAAPANFWMRNTPLPLDILFIRSDRSIARIARRTVPYSLDFIPSGEPVVAVLEIAGGEADRLSIREGDRVSW